MRVFAVIVGYRNPRLTVKAAQSLAAQTVPVSIVVWDNYSDPTTRKVIKEADQLRCSSPRVSFPVDATVVMSPTNELWTPAVNAAVETYLADEDYILMMNNDCALPKQALASLVDVFEQHPDAGLVGPLCTALGGPQEPLNAVGLKQPFRATFILGACMMVRRSVWDEVGPLAPDMPLGADDHDYCIRVKHAGYSIWVDPRVCADHRGHASQGPEWDEWGGKCWDVFNKRYAGYYATEEEAIKAHWGGVYCPGFERGTGWTEEEYQERVRW